MTLKGKVVLLTGGARVGRTVAAWLAGRGAHLAVTYRSSRAAAESVVRAARKGRVRAAAYPADLADPAAARALVAAVGRDFGRLDALVHMASQYRKTPWPQPDGRAWRDALAGELSPAYDLALAAAPLLGRRGGRIVLISDWVAASGRPRYRGYLPYYVAKRALQGLAEALALELAPKVTVNAIAPGPILPPPDLSSRERAAVEKVTPLRRWGGPAEIARAVVFLLESEFVTGETVRVDGGRHLD